MLPADSPKFSAISTLVTIAETYWSVENVGEDLIAIEKRGEKDE